MGAELSDSCFGLIETSLQRFILWQVSIYGFALLAHVIFKLLQMEQSDQYAGLSKRDIALRQRMAERLGRQATHLAPLKPEELKVNTDKFVKPVPEEDSQP